MNKEKSVFRFTSEAIDGCMLFTYKNGILLSAEICCELTEVQQTWLSNHFPVTINMHDRMTGKGGKMEEEATDLGLDSFWRTYGVKINRKRTTPLWAKLSNADRIAVFASIPKYKRYVAAKGISMVNPENYLRDERWDDVFELPGTKAAPVQERASPKASPAVKAPAQTAEVAPMPDSIRKMANRNTKETINNPN